MRNHETNSPEHRDHSRREAAKRRAMMRRRDRFTKRTAAHLFAIA